MSPFNESLNLPRMDSERILSFFMMDIGEYPADIQRNCEAISPIRAKHGGRYCLSIPMNEARYSPISIIKNDSIHIVTQ